MSRKSKKSNKRIRCNYSKCNRDAFKKSLGYYYRGQYFCSKGHARKAMKEQEIKNEK